jgi:hypothetical protein
MKVVLLIFLSAVLFWGCRHQAVNGDSEEIKDQDLELDTANAQWTWMGSYEFVNRNYTKSSTYRQAIISYSELPFHTFYDNLFESLSIPYPDSIIVSYRHIIEQKDVYKQIDPKIVFLNVSYGLSMEDGPPEFDKVHNPKNFEAFQKEYDCCYTYVYGFVDFQNNELMYEFGEGGWVNKIRYIVYGPNKYLKIHTEGNKSITTRVYLNNRPVDSTYFGHE